MKQLPLPVVRLLPKAKPQVIRHGFPWVFANELVMDRRTKGLSHGGLVVLEDAERRPLGLGTINPKSKIAVRMLDFDPDAQVDEAWFAAKLTRAFKTVIKNGTGRARSLEGLDEDMAVAYGPEPKGPVSVQMNGATYMADVMGGQKTGLFLDQRPNHAFAATLAKGGKILDVFSHVGGFALAALAGGAASALSVDGSAAALNLAQAGADASGVADRFETRQGDAFDVLETLGKDGATFDVVVCDPPAFAPSKATAEKGLRAYERVARLAAPLVKDGGYLVLCSCSHAADLKRFRDASARGIGRGGRRPQLVYTGSAGPDHPLLPQLAESGYLKALAFRL